MTELVRSACLTDFPEVARSLGLRPDILMSAAGIDRSALTDADMRISVQAVAHLLELASRESGIEAFALLLAEQRQVSVLGPIALLLREEPTVRHAVRSLAKYLPLQNEALALRLNESDGEALVAIDFPIARQRAFRQGAELTIGVLFRAMQSLIGKHWQPVVCFMHEPPERQDVHFRLFGPHVEFGGDCNGLIVASQDLDLPVAGADPVLAEHARRYLDTLMDNHNAGFKSKVRELVRVQITSGRCTADRLAEQMGCNRRTLHRKLAQEDATFDAVLHSVRSELAVQVLQNRQVRLASAADALGFSSGSAFSRWFLDSFGKRPSEWRKEL